MKKYSLDFHNVLIRPQFTSLSSRSQVNLIRTFTFPHSTKTWSGIPMIAANMDTTGTFEVYDVLSKHKMLTALSKFYTYDDYVDAIDKRESLDPDYFMVSSGITDNDIERLDKIMDLTDCNWICLDVANGYMSKFVDACAHIREKYPDKIIVAGNVATHEAVNRLIHDGKVDIVKCGIGSGAACITRLKAGVGVPQLSVAMNCSHEAHEHKGYIVSDGGITCPGDASKAFGAGADFVMCGGVFSGHDENPGELIEVDGMKYKLFYGMSSEHAMQKHFGGMNKYRSSEGRVIRVPYKGPLENTVLDYLGGLRSACTYTNSYNLTDLANNVEFIEVSQQLNTSLIR
jgi:GMP reductase